MGIEPVSITALRREEPLTFQYDICRQVMFGRRAQRTNLLRAGKFGCGHCQECEKLSRRHYAFSISDVLGLSYARNALLSMKISVAWWRQVDRES